MRRDRKNAGHSRAFLNGIAFAGFGVYLLAVFALSRGAAHTVQAGRTVPVTAKKEGVTEQSGQEIAAASSSVEESGGSGTVTVSAAGDCTLGTDENFDYSTSFPAMYEKVGDPSWFLQKVQDVFSKDDLTIVNLEGTLTTATSRADKTFAFKGDPSYTAILTEGSVEAVNLANNHSHDYGEQSYEDTIRNVEAEGISSFGYDRNATVDVNGVKVALIGIYELAEGIGCKQDLIAQIQEAKQKNADLIIVSFHWGTEKAYYPDDTQVELAHTAIDEGASLVLGHHPHVLEGIEKYKGRNIVYSLGNFCFGGNKNPSDKDTMIFQQTFTVKNGKVADDDDSAVIPCSLSSVSSYNNYQPAVLTGSEAERVTGRIEEYSAGL